MVLTATKRDVPARAGLPAAKLGWEAWSDLDLVRAGSADLEAFGELVRRHQDLVFGVVLRIVRNRTHAEDLTQDAFLRAFRALDAFRGDAAVRSWLYRIARNLAINEVTRHREFPSDRVPDAPARDLSPSREVETADLRTHLHESIAELPAALRVPLVLREFEYLTYQEIADTTGLPLNTVRTRILRARRSLRSNLEAWR